MKMHVTVAKAVVPRWPPRWPPNHWFDYYCHYRNKLHIFQL